VLGTHQHRLVIVPYGRRSGVCGARCPRRHHLRRCLRRMNRILELNRRRSPSAVPVRHDGNAFERRSMPRATPWATIRSRSTSPRSAGWMQRRAAGQYSTRYGSIEYILLAVEAVLPDGLSSARGRARGLHRTGPAPSLSRLRRHAGIVTEATLRIFPCPETSVGQSFQLSLDGRRAAGHSASSCAPWKPPGGTASTTQLRRATLPT